MGSIFDLSVKRMLVSALTGVQDHALHNGDKKKKKKKHQYLLKTSCKSYGNSIVSNFYL